MADFPVTANRTPPSGLMTLEPASTAYPVTPNRTPPSGLMTLEAASSQYPATPNRTPPSGYLSLLTGPFVRNESPILPGCVVATSSVAFQLGTLKPDLLDLTTAVVQLSINFAAPVTAYDGGAGGFQAGYSGSVTDVSTAIEDLRDFVVTPAAAFPDGASVMVFVFCDDDSANPIAPPSTWSFCIETPAPPPPFSVLLVTPVNSNTLRVYFSKQPKAMSPLGSDDVLNRFNWTISLVSGPGKVPVVEKIENPQAQPDFDPTNYPDAWSVDVRTNQRVLQKTEYLTIAGSTIVAADGDSLAAPPNDRDDHPGIMVARPRAPIRPAATTAQSIDLFYDTFEGVYRLDGRSDLNIHGGLSALKKRIIRRMMSRKGGFFHLVDYGLGLQSKVPADPTRLGEIQNEARRQVLEEEEVAEARVSIARTSAGVFIIVIEGRTRSGAAFDLTFEGTEDGRFIVG